MSNLQEHIQFNFYLFLIFLFVLITQQVVKKFFKYRNITSKLPTVYGLPFLGIVHRLLPLNKFLPKLGLNFEKLKSSTFFTWFGNEPVIITVDPDIIKNILNSDEFLNKAPIIYQAVDNAVPSGLLTSRSFKWKHNRKLLNTAFTVKIVQRFKPIFKKSTESILNHFDSLASHEEHSIFEYIKAATMQNSLQTSIGANPKNDAKLQEGQLIHGFHQMFDKIIQDFAFSQVKLGFLIRTSTYYNIMNSLRTYVGNLVDQNICSNSININNDLFLHRAIKLQEKGLFQLDDTLNETFTIIIGSYETTAVTLYSCIVMLAMHTDVQERLYQDIIQILPDPNADIEFEHFEQLPYLTMIIDETLRLMPPVPLIGRETLENCNLTPDVILPRDFQIYISIFHLHRNKQLWGPDADKFNPDNFLPENREKRHPYAFVPFSKGARNCLGWRYAEIALRFMLIDIVRKFKFATTFQYEDLLFLVKISLYYLKEPKIEVIKR